jgi:hypothetical protein
MRHSRRRCLASLVPRIGLAVDNCNQSVDFLMDSELVEDDATHARIGVGYGVLECWRIRTDVCGPSVEPTGEIPNEFSKVRMIFDGILETVEQPARNQCVQM